MVRLAANGGSGPNALAVRMWTGRNLGVCLRWLAERSLHAPPATLSDYRREQLDLRPTDAPPTFAFESAPEDECDAGSQVDPTLQALTRELADDVRVSAFPITLERIGHDRIAVVASLGLAPLFLPRARRLFVPQWLIADAPRLLFPPSPLFSASRRSSLAWLLLDALVPTVSPVTTVQNYYGFH